MRTTVKSWLFLAGMCSSLAVADFAPPAEGPVAFRRYKIPLEAGAMTQLSKQLRVLASGLRPTDASTRRGAAQMLALALALDPANTKARDLLSQYKLGTHKTGGNPEHLEASRARIKKVISWLETPEAGTDGQALAACLKDVVIISEPDNPNAAELRAKGEQGAWAEWIPDVSEYEKKVITHNDKPKKPKPAIERPVQKKILLENAEVLTPLWRLTGTGDSKKWILTPAPLQMSAKLVTNGEEGESMFSIVIGREQGFGSLDQLADWLKVLLKKQHGELPHGVRIQITSKEFEASLASRKRLSISAAAAVLASSAVTGRAPAEATIIGQIDKSGAFKLPTRFWYQLQALGKGNGQRLILPSDAEDYLTSILAMEKPEFFLDHEVLLAADFKQLLAMSTNVADERLATASAKFQEIHDRAGTQDARSYIANTFVKQRLASVLQDMPSHFSAKMLLIQASGKRPIWISRKVLAAELRRALEPVDSLVGRQGKGDIKGTYELCHANMQTLDRYTAKEDRELLEEARAFLSEIRNLDRAMRSRGEDYEIEYAVQTAATNMEREYSALVRKLANETGETSGNDGH